MNIKTRNLGLVFLIGLTSCDPGIGVVISNKTRSDKNIQVFYPPGFRFPGDEPHVIGERNSIRIYASDVDMLDSTWHMVSVPKLNWDTTRRTYSFILRARHDAIVEQRFLATHPTLGQIFVIDGVDTVKLVSFGDFIKRPRLRLGGEWKYTIRDRSSNDEHVPEIN